MISKEEWEEAMLENNSYWELDIIYEKRLELRRLERSLWSRIWNWRKIARIKKQLNNENQDKK